MALLEQLRRKKLIAILRGVPEDQVADLAGALAEGGISILEVPLDHQSPEGIQAALRKIRRIGERLGERVLLGAGTILTAEQAERAAEAGARFLVAPNVNDTVIAAAKRLGLLAMPGALTPTEAAQAWESGADVVKVFPAGAMGADYLRALRAPLPHIPLAAVGGVNLENCRLFLEAGAQMVGIGGSLVPKRLEDAADYDGLCRAARAYSKAVQSVTMALS